MSAWAVRFNEVQQANEAVSPVNMSIKTEMKCFSVLWCQRESLWICVDLLLIFRSQSVSHLAYMESMDYPKILLKFYI